MEPQDLYRESITITIWFHQQTRPVQRSPSKDLLGTPSTSIRVVPANIASGIDLAIAVNHGLKPRGYTLSSLTGFEYKLKYRRIGQPLR